MASEIPFSISATLTFPPDDGEPAVDRKADGSSSFKVLSEFRYDLVGTGTQAVNFGSIVTGAKAVMIEVDPDPSPSAQPITVASNAGTGVWQLAPGGHMTYYNPKPAAGGVTALSITYASSCTVRVRLLG